MLFEALDIKKHNRNNFDCKIPELNCYLQQFAKQDVKRSLSKIYVLADDAKIIGYYSLSAHSVKRDNLPENKDIGIYQEIPFLLLGRLAVDKNYQGNGYGDALIYHAMKITKESALKIGIFGMIVEAKNAQAISFYENFGFIRLNGNQNRLMLPINSFL